MKVLVCGATGFIGHNIVNHCISNEEYKIKAIYHKTTPPQYLKNHPQIEWIKADLTKAHEVDLLVKGIDIIIQAAATTSGANEIVNKPYFHVTDNALMNSLLLRSAFEHKVKHFIFFSCTVMYPSQSKPVLEEDFNCNITPKYFGVGWTKVYIEKMCEFYSQISDTKFTVIRHSNIYGPWDKFDLEKSHVFGATVTKVMTAQNKKITVWGEGTEKRDLLYIDDLLHFISLALKNQKEKFELVNVGSGKAVSVKDLVQKMIVQSGRKVELVFDRSKPTLPFNLSVNRDKAQEIFGWKPQVSLEEGIDKTLKWYCENYETHP
ncbi:MAG: NAD(P)-dependent oxidoreductase [Deltaproteobacteria bacterium]|nr:NAD(P)-dependent oxidoreductase [Deltaproteobacteria bacterium]